MSRSFAFLTLVLTAAMAFMIGLIVAGSLRPGPATPQPQLQQPPALTAAPMSVPMPLVSPVVAPSNTADAVSRQAAGLVNFADVAQRINPAVVNIEATTRGEPNR